jgi:uncharacterized peroxidase-related enzyme
MPHIALPPDLPGILGPMTMYPDTERPLNDLCNTLMCGPSSLTRAEREMIATYVSQGNACRFCAQSHAAAARHLLGEQAGLMDAVLEDLSAAPVDAKLRALLVIADKVRCDGKLVSAEDIAQARAAGADDRAIHDTVLIAAAFCMFNRYVDGLATWTPSDPEAYRQIGQRIAQHGYGSLFRKRDAGGPRAGGEVRPGSA